MGTSQDRAGKEGAVSCAGDLHAWMHTSAIGCSRTHRQVQIHQREMFWALALPLKKDMMHISVYDVNL